MTQLKKLDDETREQLSTLLTTGFDDDHVTDIIDPERSGLPLDAGLEVYVEQVPEPDWDTSHHHETETGVVLHLGPQDAREFDRILCNKWLLPLLAREMGLTEGSDAGHPVQDMLRAIDDITDQPDESLDEDALLDDLLDEFNGDDDKDGEDDADN